MDIVNYVIYTDGSFKMANAEENIGHRGCGIHGYAYIARNTITKPQNDLPPNWVTTETSYSNDKTEKKKLVAPLWYIDQVISCANLGSAPTAELEAVVYGLYNIIHYTIQDYQIGTIHLWTDSTYVIGILQKLLEDNIDNTNTHDHLISKFKEIVEPYLKEHKISIKIHKSMAHTGELGNEIADKLAFAGRELSWRHIFGNWTNVVSKNYWKSIKKINPLINFKQLYFNNTIKALPDEILYQVMDYGTKDEPGKKTADTCFGLVKLHEPDEMVSAVISEYLRESYSRRIFNPVNVINLRNLYNRNSTIYWELLNKYEFKYMYKYGAMYNIFNDYIAHPVIPSGLATQALDRLKELYEIMQDYNTNRTLFQYKDITEDFYDITTTIKKKEPTTVYKSKINSATAGVPITITLNGKEVTVPLILGKDTLAYGSFKHLEGNTPIVTLVIKPLGENVYQYYTVIQTLEDLAVYTNYHSSRIFVNK